MLQALPNTIRGVTIACTTKDFYTDEWGREAGYSALVHWRLLFRRRDWALEQHSPTQPERGRLKGCKRWHN